MDAALPEVEADAEAEANAEAIVVAMFLVDTIGWSRYCVTVTCLLFKLPVHVARSACICLAHMKGPLSMSLLGFQPSACPAMSM